MMIPASVTRASLPVPLLSLMNHNRDEPRAIVAILSIVARLFQIGAVEQAAERVLREPHAPLTRV
jgi:hypothetical protein